MSALKTNNIMIKTLGILMVLLIFVGCSNSPMNSETTVENPVPQLLKRSVPSDGPQLSPIPLYADTVFDPSVGGTLHLFDVTLEVPAGAVDYDAKFSINIPDINVFYNEFGTHGLVFKVPVKVTMSYRDADLTGINESTIRIGWFNPTTGLFEDVECAVDVENKQVSGYLNHFSAYALISD